MKYSVQSNEMMGFLNMLTANDRQQKMWKTEIPDLNGIDFNGLVEFISKNNILNTDFFKKIDPRNYSLRDFEKAIPKKYKKFLEIAYKAYHSFYEKSGVEKYARQIEEKINSLEQESFQQMARFYSLKNANNHTTTAYALASIDGSGSCSLSGQEKTFQLLTVKIPVDENMDIKKDISKLFHETAHGILEDSGSEKVLKEYFELNPGLSQFFQKYPILKRHETDNASLMVDEFLTTAFQKMFARDTLEIESSYRQPTIAAMAKKMVGSPEKPGILAEALKNGETFGSEFLKKLEKEFELAIPEIEKEITQTKESTHIFSTLLNGQEDGKNDPRDEAKTPQTNTEKKTTFPTTIVVESQKQRK